MSSSQKIDRSCELDVVRCVANYLIVLLHGWAAFQYVANDTVEFYGWTFVCSHLSWLAIPSFFMISGYLLFRGFSLRVWPNKMNRRIRRLAVPYLAWNLLFVAFYLTMAHFVPRLGQRVATFGLDSFAGAFSKILSLTVGPIDGPLWFLRVLFLFAVASPILWCALRARKGIPVLVLSVAWCVGESALGLTKALHLTAPAYALVCFLLGGVIAENGRDLVDVIGRRWKTWLAIGLAACVVRAVLIMKEIPAGAIISLLACLEAPVLIAAVSRVNVGRIVENRLYITLREMSFFAYAGHFLFCSMWLHTLAPFFPGHWTGKFTILILVFVICGVLTMAAVYWLGKKLCPRVMKVFDGTL